MKNKSRLFGIYLPLFALVTLSAVVMRSVAAMLYFNSATGFFENQILISISDYTVMAAAVFFLSFIFTKRKDMRLIPSFTTPATYIPTGITATALLFFAVYLFGSARDAAGESLLNAALTLICGILAILSAAHFALTALVEGAASAKRGMLGLCTVAFLAITALILYFDGKLPLNAPGKILDQMTLLFSAAFFLFETRLSIGREKWREYIAFGFISAMLTSYSSIPALICYFIKTDFTTENEFLLSDNIYLSAVIFSLFIFILARLMLTGELIEDKTSPHASAIISAAERREQEIAPTPAPEEEITQVEGVGEEEAEVDTENQITIEDIAEPQVSIELPEEESGEPKEEPEE